MNKFRKLGLVDYDGNGSLTVHSGLLGVVAHGQPAVKPSVIPSRARH
jgi:hypothetical protein